MGSQNAGGARACALSTAASEALSFPVGKAIPIISHLTRGDHRHASSPVHLACVCVDRRTDTTHSHTHTHTAHMKQTEMKRFPLPLPFLLASAVSHKEVVRNVSLD